MIQCTLYTFEKKQNSTLLPTSENVVRMITTVGEFKSATEVTSPVVRFKFEGNPVFYNYAYISDFSRYYFINNWEYINGIWEAYMEVDTLASFKYDIGNSTEYILRSSAEYDDTIIDTIAPTKAVSTITEYGNANPGGYNWSGDLSKGTYVVGIINSSANAVGAVAYYKFTPDQMRTLCNKMLGNPDYLGIEITEISTALQQALFNPWQYVASVMWFPFDVAQSNTINNVSFGWWAYDITCARIASWGYSLAELVFAVPRHPQYQSKGRYLNNDPFSRYSIFIPAFGEFDIPSQYLFNVSQVTAQIITDSITGMATMQLFAGDKSGKIIAFKQAQVGVPIQFGYTSYSDGKGIAALGIAQGANALAKVFNSQIADIASTISAGVAETMTNFSSVGSNGTLSQFYFVPKITGHFISQAEIPDNDTGRPLFGYRIISEIPGYIRCLHGDINTIALTNEKEMIKNYLESGFYYE